MPNPNSAIPGQASLSRQQKKAKRLAQEGFSDIPPWAKTWEPWQMENYVDIALDGITDLDSAKTILKNILPKMAWMCGALRDYMLLKQGE